MIATDMVGEDECIPFPHEAHQVLTQEILHVFSAGALVAAGISSGLSVLGGLLGGARVVAICSSKSHQKCPEERDPMVEGEEAGPQLQQWEQKKGRGGPSPAPKSMASPSNGSSPPPTPNAGAGVSASANGSSPGPTPNAGAASSNGGPGRSLLGAFGNVSM